MKTMNKLLSLFLVAVMLVSMIPSNVFADETTSVHGGGTPEASNEAAPQEVADSDVAKIGDTGYATLADAVTAAAAGDTIILLADISYTNAVTVQKKITIKAESAVTVTKTGTNEWLLIKANGDVTLEGPITVVGNTKYGALIEVASKGILTMNDGVTLKDNQTNESKVGSAVNIIDGSFTMNGGTIDNCDNTASESKPGSTNGGTMGGAIRISLTKSGAANAAFVMNGGTIKNCDTKGNGGAVGVENLGNTKGYTASFTMNGGTITGCSQSASSANYAGGAAIYIYNKIYNNLLDAAVVTINGGSITGNTGEKCGTLGIYTGSMGNTYGGKYYILGGTISGNVVGNGTPGGGYGNGVYVDRLINGEPVLTIGGSAVIDDEIHLKSSAGNYFEIRDDFTGSVKVYSQAGGTGSTPVYGSLVAKAVSSTGVASTATKEIAGKITAVYGQSLDENGKVYEHPVYDIVLGTNSDEYVLGEYSAAAETYTVTVDTAIANGTVTAEPTEAEEGAEITLTVTPAEGYELASLAVTDASGAAVTVTDNKFTMPASDVTVTASFTEAKLTPAGDIFRAYLNASNGRINADLFNISYNESVALQLYSGEILLTTATLNATEFPGPATKSELTGSICVKTWNDSDTWVIDEKWTAWDNIIPTEIKLVVDGKVVDTHTLIYNANPDRGGTEMTAEDWADFPGTLALPNGNNVTTNLVKLICDTDTAHEAVTVKWQSGTIVIPNTSPVWNEELGAWTVGIRLDSIGTKYVWPHFEEKYDDINHDIVDSCLTEPEYSRIETTLKWDESKQLWVTLDGQPIEIHVTCQTKPTAPSGVWHLSKYQIKVVGTVNGEEKVHFEFLDLENITIGEVQGNRTDGFSAEITVPVASVNTYKDAWVAKYDAEFEVGYRYDDNTPETVTFTVWYTGDTTGTLYGERTGDWALVSGDTFGTVGTAYVVFAKDVPALPEKLGGNVTPDLVTIICDSDHERHPNLTGKWYNSPCKIYPTISTPVWDRELGAWTIGIRIQQLDTFYTDKMCDTYGIWHDHVNGVGSVEDDMIVTTLKWDETAQLWVPTETIELHTVCKAKPDAPIHIFMNNYQVQVNGDLDHDGIYGENGLLNNGIYEQYTTSIPEGAYTLSEVYGSREEGFFIDVTTTLADGDIYFQNWVAERAENGKSYAYDWDLTEETITFTLKYAGDTTGTLYGTRSGEWVLPATGEYWGVVAKAYVKEDIPAPGYDSITDELVTVICDSDGGRHAPVVGDWYRQHSTIYSDTLAWNAELNTWTIDIKIDSLYTMYVAKLEKANGNTQHTIVNGPTDSIFTTLKWDYDQKLWVPVEDIEIHTECRTAPVAPVYETQLETYQIQVYGMVDGKEQVFTTAAPESSMTIGEVYGSREEGFYVDVSIEIVNDDAFITNWVAQKAPGQKYYYDWTKTPRIVNFKLKYNGDLNGTLHGDRYAVNTNIDWVLTTTGKDFGVVGEAYLTQTTYPVNIVIYRNGNTTDAYRSYNVANLTKGDILNLDELNIADYYSATNGFVFEGWYNDGGWNSYKAGNPNYTLSGEITVNGWTNIVCMVTDYQVISVKGVINGNKDTAESVFTGKALYGTNLIEWLDANVEIPEKTGYTADKWYNWDWYGHKFNEDKVVTGWTNVYVDYQANEYTLTLNPNGGKVDPATITVTYNEVIGELPTPTLTNSIFDGWYDAEGNEVTAETVYTVAGDSTITAKWIALPGVTSVTNELFTVQCTEVHDHKWVVNMFTNVEYVKDSIKWDAENNRWVAQIKVKTSFFSLINSSTTKRNYFGGITHHYESGKTLLIDVYFDPDFTGLSSSQKETTGLWLPAQEYVAEVYCYTEPSMPNISKITSKALWVRDTDPAYKTTTKTTKYTVKQLIAGTYTLGEMYTENGKFYVDLTITDLAPYIQALSQKNGKDYVLPEWTNHKNADDFKFKLVYTGSTTDYEQDGTGWSVDESSYTTSKEKNNGVSVWLTEQFTVTYTDGVENKELFADQSYTVNAFTEKGGTKDDWADFSATATPTIEDPTRTGYTFAGWTPAVAETVTGDATYTAAWEVVPVTVYYYVNGELVNTVVLNTEETVTAYNVYDYLPEKVGYTLDAWYEKAGDIGNAKKAEPKTEQNFLNKKILRLYASSTANTYNVTLDAGEGTVDPAALTVTFDSAYGELPTPVYPGYIFKGWYLGEEQVTAETVVATAEDHTLTAKWQLIELKVYYKIDGVEVNAFTLTGVPATEFNVYDYMPEKAGYTLICWYEKEADIGNTNKAEPNAAQDFTYKKVLRLYGSYTPNTYTVTLDPNGGAVEPTTLTVTFDAAIGELPVPTKEGYTFIGWLDAEGKKVLAETLYTVVGDSTLTAEWSANAYTITLDAKGGEVDPAAVNVIYNEAINTLPVPTKEGHTFTGWVDAEGAAVTAETIYTVVGDSTLTATWTANQYTITLDANGGELDASSVTVTYGEAIGELPVPTRTGYTFVGWTVATQAVYGDEPALVGPETVYDLADNVSLVAVWTANEYALTLDANGGKVDPATVPVTFDAAIGELPVPTKEGHTFAGWATENGGVVSAETVYNVAGNYTLTAVWTVNQYTLTLDVDGDTTTKTVTYGEAIGELPAPTKEGYTFTGWVDAAGNAVTAETVYTNAADMTITATWEKNPDPEVPETGDELFFVIMNGLVLSCAALMLLISQKKRFVK